jgi:hypothetical protein
MKIYVIIRTLDGLRGRVEIEFTFKSYTPNGLRMVGSQHLVGMNNV